MAVLRLHHNVGVWLCGADPESTSWDDLLADARGVVRELEHMQARGWEIESRDGRHVFFVRTVVPRRKARARRCR
jgi:hypothetical protein